MRDKKMRIKGEDVTTRERIDKLIAVARIEKRKFVEHGVHPTTDYWNGYINALEELKLFVQPKERSINDESS